ncbi:MAG TPA: DNA replication/repair protein RecF [Gammaproteobacteria bacterium]
MSLSYLEVNQFRNLHRVQLEPDAKLNIITGINASGKTSLLESIFYLSYGRSFRTAYAQEMINHEHDHFRLLAKLNTDRPHQIGIQRFRKEQHIRIDQQDSHRISDLASLLPVIALHPDSHQLISAGPEHRRQFMDWGVFHVEHSFIQEWRNYRKALSQRNAALRHNEPDRSCRIWHHAMAEHAEVIHQLRHRYLDMLRESLAEYAIILFPDNSVTLDYKKGWSEQDSYFDHLESSLTRDKEKGYTLSGPHRGDIVIKVDQQSAQTSISRGQQKKLVALLKLAQLDLFIKTSSKPCTLLYDDLPAELDTANRKILMDSLASMNVQLFVTTIESNSLNTQAWSSGKMFHVEQGVINQLNQ